MDPNSNLAKIVAQQGADAIEQQLSDSLARTANNAVVIYPPDTAQLAADKAEANIRQQRAINQRLIDQARSGEDGEDARDIERLNRDGESSVEQEVRTACTELAGDEATNSEMAAAAQKMYNIYGKRGDQEKAEIADELTDYF